MHIAHLEIANFRKLLSVRIDLADKTTLFVGANNSGKTSAMLALRRFLAKRGRTFEKHDLTLCHWAGINALGQTWMTQRERTPGRNAARNCALHVACRPFGLGLAHAGFVNLRFYLVTDSLGLAGAGERFPSGGSAAWSSVRFFLRTSIENSILVTRPG